MKRDITSLKELSSEEIWYLINKALSIKNANARYSDQLKGYTLGLLFDKVSTRTRLSFEVAMFRLGGNTIFVKSQDTQLSREESIKDTALVLSRYLDAIAIRTYEQGVVEDMAKWASIPVINALTDKFHPCQILSDLLTVVEKKSVLRGLKIAWVGDGNNVANSWIQAAKILGFELYLACPEGFWPARELIDPLPHNIHMSSDPEFAAKDADVLNTDVWVSMGQEGKRQEKIKAFRGFSIDKRLVSMAKKDVIVMHCLPAHRGEEISDEVMDGPNSVVFDQAENKLYMHQAILLWLLLDTKGGVY